MNPILVVHATIACHRCTYLLFILLVAVATAIGVGITTQEAALRIGSARAADKFDVSTGRMFVENRRIDHQLVALVSLVQ